LWATQKFVLLFWHFETFGRSQQANMFETIASTTPQSVPLWTSFGNITTALATTTTLAYDAAFDFNATTDIWGNASSDGNAADVEQHPCDRDNQNFNCTVDEFLNYYLGAKQMPLEHAIWVS